MREELRDPGRLEHILASIDRINNFVEGHIADDLKGDSQLFYAVVKNLEIIGEAAYMLSPAPTSSYTNPLLTAFNSHLV